MDHTQLEVDALEQTIVEARETQVRELKELQLALVGGGFGDTVI